MEKIKNITIINDDEKTVHVKVLWPEGEESYILEHREQIQPRLEDILENTEIEIEAAGESTTCIYSASAGHGTVRLSPMGLFEWTGIVRV